MKKILSLVLAIMMVLSMATTVFAAPVDVTDKAQVKAVDALTSLGIVKGYDDGSFKPENIITRAELAKMLVEALGQGSLVDGSESSFKDAKGKWYDGYVALAAGLELVTGYPDGTFKGDNTVTYQEAVNMVLRAVGYTNQSVNNGVDAYNPTRYKTLALSLGILNNVTFKNGGANRGEIASMVYNALTVERVQTNEKGLAEKIVVGKKLEQVPGSSPAVYREVSVYEVLLEKLTTKADVNVTTSTKYIDGVDLTQYLGQNVTAFLSADGKVMFVEKSNSKTVAGTISTSSATTVKMGTETYTVPTTAAVYLNGAVDTFVLSSHYDNLVNAKATVVYAADGTTVNAVVATNETRAKHIVNVYRKDAASIDGIALPTDAGKVDLSKITVTGEVTALEDIQKNDVVKVYATKGNAIVKLLVVRDSAEGKIIETNNAGTKVVISEVGEKETATKRPTLAAQLGKEGTFYFDEAGKIFEFVPKGTTAPATKYAMITAKTDAVMISIVGGSNIAHKNPVVKSIAADGTKTTYTIAMNAKYDVLSSTGAATSTNSALVNTTTGALQYISEGMIIKSATVEDGQLVKLVIQTPAEIGSTGDEVDPKARTFDAASNAAVFNFRTSGSAVVTATNNTVEQLLAGGKITVSSTVKVKAIINANGEKSVVIIEGTDLIAQESDYALIVGQKRVLNADDEVVQELTVYINGEKHVYLTSEDLENNYSAGRNIYRLAISGDTVTNEPTPVTANVTPYTITSTGTAIDVKSSIKFTHAGQTYYMDDNAPVYILNKDFGFIRVGDISDLSAYNITVYIYHDGSNGVNNIVLIQK